MRDEGPPAQSFECGTCGAPAVFSPEAQALSCQHCGASTPIEAPADGFVVAEYDFDSALAALPTQSPSALTQDGHEVECDNCGARFVLAGVAGRCAYCDSPNVVDVRRSQEMLRPESLLPFGISAARAREVFKQWLGSRWFAPNDLKQRARDEEIEGVYMPYFTYDARTHADYAGMRGEYYYVTESYTDGQGRRRSRTVRKTRWWPTNGRIRHAFDDVLVSASTSLPADLVQALEPWDLAALTPFKPEYLSGFLAERYSVDLRDGFELAKLRMEPVLRARVRQDIGGDTQRILWMRPVHDQVVFKHLLLPVWISSFRYREEVYRFIVNARTGEVSGMRPWSWIKITLTALLVAALLGAAFVYLQR